MPFAKTSIFALLLLSAPAFATSTKELLQQLENTEDGHAALSLAHQFEPDVPAWPALDQGRFYIQLGLIQEDKLLDINSADTSFNRAVGILEAQHKVSQPLADAYYERAYIKYLRTHNTAAYCPDRQKAVAITRQLNNPDLLTKYLTSLAFCYTDSPEHFQQGLAVLDEAITLADKKNLSADRRGMIYNATALLYQTSQFYDKAYAYSKLAYDQWVTVNNIQGMDDQQHTMLLNAINMGELDKAEEHGKQLFKLADTSPQFKGFRFFAYYDTGTVAMVKNELPRAIKLFQQAKTEEKNTEETAFIAMNRAQLARAYFMNGNSKAAMKEADEVASLPGYASLDPVKQQTVQALLQFQKGNLMQAMRTLLYLVHDEQQRRRQFVKSANRNYETQHENRIHQFEKQLLENKLQIQQLQLDAQQRQEQVSRWYLLLISATGVSLALLAYTLLRSRSRFRKLAHTDSLTGIANRRYFFHCIHKLMKRTNHQQRTVSILVLDIDHFKCINDIYGHQAGDAAIKHVAVNVLTCLRTHDLLGRMGGEEFAATLHDTEVEQAWNMAERIRLCIEQNSLNYNGDHIRITVSIGVATGRLPADSIESLLQMADQAMYRAKAAGRNRSHIAGCNSSDAATNEITVTTNHPNTTVQT